MQKQLTFNIDALEITFTATQDVKNRLMSILKMKEQQGFIGQVLLKRTDARNYHYSFVIIWKNRYWGQLVFGSPNKFRPDVYVRVHNDILYNRELFADRYVIAEMLGLQFYRVSKLDIAADFNFNVQRRLLKAYKDEAYKLVINGDVENSPIVHHVGGVAMNNPRQRPFLHHELIARNGDGTLTMKCYNKAKETVDNWKDYIVTSNGFKGLSMYRVEMTCKNYTVLKPTLKGLVLSDEDLYHNLNNGSVLARVFADLMDRVIRLQKGRRSYNLLSVAIDGLDVWDMSA